MALGDRVYCLISCFTFPRQLLTILVSIGYGIGSMHGWMMIPVCKLISTLLLLCVWSYPAQTAGLIPNEYVFGTLISGALRNRRYEYLTTLLKKMRHLEVLPSEPIIEMLETAANSRPKVCKNTPLQLFT